MVRALDSLLTIQQMTLHDPEAWIWLYELEVPSDPPTRYRLTNYKTAVLFGTNSSGTPLEYSRFPVRCGPIEQSGRGDLPGIRVTVGNVQREVGAMVELYDGLTDQPVVVRLVHKLALAVPSAQIRWDAKVQRVRVSDKAVTFDVASTDIQAARFPSKRYSATSCPVDFGLAECGYVVPNSPADSVGGGFSTCPKDLLSCTERGDDEEARGLTRQHPKRWGGRRGIPRS